MLASGEPKTTVSETVGIDRVTLYHWLAHPDFSAEVDRLSLMVHVSSRAERLRIAMRLVKQRIDAEGNIHSDKDLLDWLKFAQSETDGARIDLSRLAELLAGESGGQGGLGEQRQLTSAIEIAVGGGDSTSQPQDEVADDDTLNPS